MTSASNESTTRQVTLTNLTPGDYSYTVSMRLTDGNQVGTSTNVTVVPVPADCAVKGYVVGYDGTVHTAAGTYDSDSWSFTDPTGNDTSQGGTPFDVIRQATARESDRRARSSCVRRSSASPRGRPRHPTPHNGASS